MSKYKFNSKQNFLLKRGTPFPKPLVNKGRMCASAGGVLRCLINLKSAAKKLDSQYLYLDLEINSIDKIYRIGLAYLGIGEDVFEESLDFIYKHLSELKQKNLSICGHNFRRFDYTYLVRQQPEFHPWLVIDTLELSILAFPLQPSHKLNKGYKHTKYASNNPLEDARATRLLLQQILTKLSKKPQSLQQAYVWLLTCGTEATDNAYKQLFQILEVEIVEPIALAELPPEAIASFNQGYLQAFWAELPSKSFDSRLCVAALIAWNYECNITKSNRAFSGWLTYLPGFTEILNNIRPIVNEKFIYRYYLNEFGITQFRTIQLEAVQAIASGENPLILMPTGGGKSLCYQLPALMLFEQQRALTVVISPLQALMADQVADLAAAGLNFATFINGNLTAAERCQRLEQLRDGTLGLLYISPEQLRSLSIRNLLQERPPKLWVIDEAHCISQWGHDFRPDYRYIPKFIQELYQERILPLPKLALMTATATVAVRNDIKKLFTASNLGINKEIVSDSIRENLEYQVIPVKVNKEQLILQQIQQLLTQDGCVLVYTATRKNAEKLATLLTQAGIEAKHFHSKLTKTEKHEVFQAFKSGELNVVTATCAFGMGINRQDVRAVIHHTMSGSLEGYVQEAGRAGRDGQPATCTLLFNPQDADIIFSLQALNQLSETDLRNIFVSVRSLREKPSGDSNQVSEDWFWVTTNEIFHTSNLDDEFAAAEDQRDTKIKVALHNLETFNLIERAENISTFVQFELKDNTLQASQQRFANYPLYKNLSPAQLEQYQQLITAIYLAKSYYSQKEEPIPLDRLSDESGISIKELISKIRELQKAGVCTSQIPITMLVTKGVTGDARLNHQRLRKLEQELLEVLLEIPNENDAIQVNLRGLASRLDPDGSRKVRAFTLTNIIEGWATQSWVQLTLVSRDVVRLTAMEKIFSLMEPQKILAEAVIEVLYSQLADERGARLQVKSELWQLLADVNKKIASCSERELESVLLWLHRQKLIRLTEGLNLFHQALKVRVIKNANITRISSRYPEIQAHYQEQARRTHIMLAYGKTEDVSARQELVKDYFHLPPQEFINKYPHLGTKEAKRPVTEEDYNRIVDDLNPAQREIVLAEDAAIAVIAGPGSGKTRTIVHRIAYLVKVKRVEPGRILVLAYNRNAVRELRSRLQHLVGVSASRLRVFTFHGLALALLGRTIGEGRKAQELDFRQLLRQACQLIEHGDELDDADTQARRIQLLGNVEYIFVDEYQDVAEDEYRLIKLIAGLGDSGDESRSVQINLCVIGDDDQNIYQFKGTNPKYIIQFESEYKARRLLLTENYRSTQSIITAANNLISNNSHRCKRQPDEQVCINSQRQGNLGSPVQAYSFSNTSSQAAWVKEQIKSWIDSGIPANHLAVLARQWDNLSPIRALLETENIPTYALKREGIKLVRNRVVCQLISELQAQSNRILSAQESVEDWFTHLFKLWHRSLQEPTVKTLLKIAQDLDTERGYASENLALPISGDSILTTLFEFNESGDVFLEEKGVLVTSCHGAKGLEFRKVILLTDNFNISASQVESERRLFYVAITRAKEELILCSTVSSLFVKETRLQSHRKLEINQKLPQLMFYCDLTPADVYLGHFATKKQQSVITQLMEGMPLQLKTNSFGNGWAIFTQQNQEIGNLSRAQVQTINRMGIQPNQFKFSADEVTVRSIYRHLKVDDLTGTIHEDWFVVIPQIRVCR